MEATQEKDTHLWIPEPETTDEPVSSSSSSCTPQILRERLYVGNLSLTVDEYALLQVFGKFGKITKLDFLFHKSGVNRGKPRGYAFVEYLNEADAAKALQVAHGKLLRGRKLVVTFAQQAPSHNSGFVPYTGRSKRTDTTPTALSLAKSSGIARPEAKTASKIAMMEAKLRQMESSSSFAERPSLPSKPVAPQKGSLSTPKRSASHGIGGRVERTKSDVAQATHGRLTALVSTDDGDSSDITRIPPSSKQRSIPGVKIVKGGINKGTGGVAPSI